MADRQPYDPFVPLAGQIAWVTGGASGIGFATVRRLRSMGAEVAIIDIQHPDTLPDEERVYRCDVASRDAVAATAETLEALHGRGPDILVTCAAVCAIAPLADHELAAWDHHLAVNLTGTFQFVRLTSGGMAARRRGRIVLFTSDAAYMALPGLSAYSASKGGIVALGRVIAAEMAPAGVTCNVLSPGTVDTPMTRAYFAGRAEMEAAMQDTPMANAMGAVLDPEDLAHGVGFLCHPDSRHITGQVMHINAGGVMR